MVKVWLSGATGFKAHPKTKRNLYLGTFMRSITARCSSEVPKQLEIAKNNLTIKQTKNPQRDKKEKRKAKKKKKNFQLMNVMSFREKKMLFFSFFSHRD